MINSGFLFAYFFLLRAATVTYSASVPGFASASFDIKWSFNNVQFELRTSGAASLVLSSISGLSSTSASVPIDAAQCPSDRNVLSTGIYRCFDSDSMCLPPAPWGAFTATKGAQFPERCRPCRPSECIVSHFGSLRGPRHHLQIHSCSPVRAHFLYGIVCQLHYDLFTIPCSFIQKKMTGCSICGLYWLSM